MRELLQEVIHLQVEEAGQVVLVEPARVEAVSMDHPSVRTFIAALSKALQDSLHDDRVFYQGKAGRRQDNLDRVIEVGAGAVDATGHPIASVAVNAARVGIGAFRSLYADMYAARTEEFGRHNIGLITQRAAEMIARRYASQIIELAVDDPDGVAGLANYFHNKSMDALHISAMIANVQRFWRWCCGEEAPPVLSPEERLFYAMISDCKSGQVFLRTVRNLRRGQHWDAHELCMRCGVEIEGVKYTVTKDSTHEKYGFCVGEQGEEKRRSLRLLPSPEK
jgi:hypothetical protein